MTKEEAIKICNAITNEEIMFHSNTIGTVTKPSKINILLSYLDKHITIGVDRLNFNPYESDCKRTAEFLREIADALEQ